jgi:cobalt-precorrin 5A hydrolase
MEWCAVIIAGFGYRASATADSLLMALAATGAKPDVLVGLQDKDHRVLQDLGRLMNISVRLISLDAAQRQTTPTQSAASFAAHGVGSVAEATALAAAGTGGRLVATRVISDDQQATCAIAHEGSR